MTFCSSWEEASKAAQARLNVSSQCCREVDMRNRAHVVTFGENKLGNLAFTLSSLGCSFILGRSWLQNFQIISVTFLWDCWNGIIVNCFGGANFVPRNQKLRLRRFLVWLKPWEQNDSSALFLCSSCSQKTKVICKQSYKKVASRKLPLDPLSGAYFWQRSLIVQ